MRAKVRLRFRLLVGLGEAEAGIYKEEDERDGGGERKKKKKEEKKKKKRATAGV